jgi:hypothetical protein
MVVRCFATGPRVQRLVKAVMSWAIAAQGLVQCCVRVAMLSSALLKPVENLIGKSNDAKKERTA